jgi:hypothetical protein
MGVAVEIGPVGAGVPQPKNLPRRDSQLAEIKNQDRLGHYRKDRKAIRRGGEQAGTLVMCRLLMRLAGKERCFLRLTQPFLPGAFQGVGNDLRTIQRCERIREASPCISAAHD